MKERAISIGLTTAAIAAIGWAITVERRLAVRDMLDQTNQRVQRLEDKLEPILIELAVRERLDEMDPASANKAAEEEVGRFLMEQRALPARK